MDSQSPNDHMDLDHGDGFPDPLEDIAEQSPSSQVQDLEDVAVSFLTSAASDIRFSSKSPTPTPPPGLLEELAGLQALPPPSQPMAPGATSQSPPPQISEHQSPDVPSPEPQGPEPQGSSPLIPSAGSASERHEPS
ncbi:hypothetical protein BJX65DRAFT_303789 [Aspergillus insuetus]